MKKRKKIRRDNVKFTLTATRSLDEASSVKNSVEWNFRGEYNFGLYSLRYGWEMKGKKFQPLLDVDLYTKCRKV